MMAAATSSMMSEFLRALKPYHDAGFINLLGVIAIFAAVFVALLPHFLRWSRRPKLHIAIPGNYFAPRQNFSNENIGVYTLSAPFILRNTGRSPASHIRAVATDFYKFLPSPKNMCEHVRSSQNALEGSEIDLPAGASAPILLCSFHRCRSVQEWIRHRPFDQMFVRVSQSSWCSCFCQWGKVQSASRPRSWHVRHASSYLWLECLTDVEPDPDGSQPRGQPGDRRRDQAWHCRKTRAARRAAGRSSTAEIPR